MRACWLGLLVIVGVANGDGSTLFAQSPQRVGVVAVKEVTLRANPKDDAPDAGSLFEGASVIIHHDEGDDWVAIQPPSGAISWINHRFINVNKELGFPQNVVVNAEGEVKIAAGKPGVNRPLATRKASIPDGTILTVVREGVKSDEDQSTWYPIVAPRDDFRYLSRKALSFGSAPIASFTVKSPVKTAGNTEAVPLSIAKPNTPATIAMTTAMTSPTTTPTTPPATTTSTSLSRQYPNKPAGWPNGYPLWVQAERAEQSNDFEAAKKHYFQLAKELHANGGDSDLANLCYTRVHSIQERIRQGTSSSTSENNSTWAPAKGDSKLTDPKNDGWTRRGEDGTKLEWTGRGFLRVSSVRYNNRTCYALEDDKGTVRYYAIAGKPDVDLERAVRKPVDLHGVISYPSDMKTAVISVTRVDVLK
jgi:hypothetical protein